MRISDLIEFLRRVEDRHGDLWIEDASGVLVHDDRFTLDVDEAGDICSIRLPEPE